MNTAAVLSRYGWFSVAGRLSRVSVTKCTG